MNTKAPLQNYQITSNFGIRSGTAHNGIDMSSGKGSDVSAFADGLVTIAVKNCVEGDRNCGFGGGNYVEIDHQNGYKTKYLHLTQNIVKVGERIKKGQKIGIEGNTGYSFGSHLHFEIIKDNIAQNPLPYLKGDIDFPTIPTTNKNETAFVLGFIVVVLLLIGIMYKKNLLALKQSLQSSVSKKFQNG